MIRCANDWALMPLLAVLVPALGALLIACTGQRRANLREFWSVAAGVVVFGLVVGKITGIALFTLLAVRLGLSALPAGAAPRHIFGISAIAGIGFTVSLFVTGLAYDTVMLQDEAKIGVLFASVVAAVIGSVVLYRSSPASIQPAADVDRPPPGT